MGEKHCAPKTTRKAVIFQRPAGGGKRKVDFMPNFRGEECSWVPKAQCAASVGILYNELSPPLGGESLASLSPSLTAGKWSGAAGLGRQVKNLPDFLNSCDSLFAGAEPQT